MGGHEHMRALNPLQRPQVRAAACLRCKYPGWDIGWDLQGFTASRGTTRLGPVPSGTMLEVQITRCPR